MSTSPTRRAHELADADPRRVERLEDGAVAQPLGALAAAASRSRSISSRVRIVARQVRRQPRRLDRGRRVLQQRSRGGRGSGRSSSRAVSAVRLEADRVGPAVAPARRVEVLLVGEESSRAHVRELEPRACEPRQEGPHVRPGTRAPSFRA